MKYEDAPRRHSDYLLLRISRNCRKNIRTRLHLKHDCWTVRNQRRIKASSRPRCLAPHALPLPPACVKSFPPQVTYASYTHTSRRHKPHGPLFARTCTRSQSYRAATHKSRQVRENPKTSTSLSTSLSLALSLSLSCFLAGKCFGWVLREATTNKRKPHTHTHTESHAH